jgi:hypothetical protein
MVNNPNMVNVGAFRAENIVKDIKYINCQNQFINEFNFIFFQYFNQIYNYIYIML